MFMRAFKRQRRLATVSMMAIAGMFASAPDARAGMKITLGFDIVETEASPRHGEYRSHFVNTYQISENKSVILSSAAGGGGKAEIGQTKTVYDGNGGSMRVALRISGGAIVITGSLPTYTVVTRIARSLRELFSG